MSQVATATLQSALITVLTGGIPNTSPSVIDAGVSAAYSNSDLSTPGFTLSPINGSTPPSAFLNYILFDENFMPLEAKSVPVGTTANLNTLISLSAAFGSAINVKEPGIMAIY